MVNKIIESDVALKWLEEGNRDYMDSIHNHGDISKEKRIYIPPMSHPWKAASFKNQLKKAHTNHVYA